MDELGKAIKAFFIGSIILAAILGGFLSYLIIKII